MLSVQSPGCAGMERLGGGAGAAGGRGAPVGGKVSIREVNMLLEEWGQCKARAMQAADHNKCPPHLALPDGEGGPDKHLCLRVPYQQSELTLTTVQPPPNKSVMDVPEWQARHTLYTASTTHKPSSPKKDGFVQKAVKYLFGGSKPSSEGDQPNPPELGHMGIQQPSQQHVGAQQSSAPCVMVPISRPPPAPAPQHSPHPPPT